VSEHPRFESLEGLRGTGKSTVTPLLAAARRAVIVPTVPDFYQPLRREIDERVGVDSRLCFYLSALLTAAEQIRRYLDDGSPVVVESYFARCLTTHQSLGARIGISLPTDLPQPITYLLVCSEHERRRRLAGREKPISRWDTLGEEATERITNAYTKFPTHLVDTTGATPHQVVRAIVDIDKEGAVDHAVTQPVGEHPHVLPPVFRRVEGTRLP
jgi:thymidylate kinase